MEVRYEFGWEGIRYRIVDGLDEHDEADPPFWRVDALAVRRLLRSLADAQAHSLVGAMHRIVVGREPPAVAIERVTAAVADRLCHPGPRAVLVGATRAPIELHFDTAVADLASDPAVEEEAALHFIELHFADGEGQPVSQVSCWVELPTGEVRAARSNDAGVVRIDDIREPGRCTVTFDGPVGTTVAPPPVDVPPPPVTVDETPREYVVTLVDELGEPLPQVELTFDGTQAASATTDDAGQVRLPDEPVPTCNVTVDYAAIEAELAERWAQPRDGAVLEDSEEVSVRLFGNENPVLVFGDQPHVFSVQPRVDQLIAAGLLFDTSKAFLLPSGLPMLRTIVTHYEHVAQPEVLIVGHTDQAGGADYNDTLSLERAESMAAFLRDDVEPWLEKYEASTSWEKRWGSHEDSLMLASLPDFFSRPPATSAVRWFQETRGLSVDGVAGPQTRRALITEYMQSDGTTLPDGASVTVHGCGESFPAQPGPDGTAAPENRRVEVFFFPPSLGVLPAPPGPISGPADPQYPTWVARAFNTLEENIEDALEGLSWHEGGSVEHADALFVIDTIGTEDREERNAAIEVHDISELSDEAQVDLGLFAKGEGGRARHGHRVQVGALRMALRLLDQGALREAVSVVLGEPQAPPTAAAPSPDPLPPPSEGEEYAIEPDEEAEL